MKYLWMSIFLLLQSCDDSGNGSDELLDVSIYTIDQEGNPFYTHSIAWSIDTAPDKWFSKSCEGEESNCSEWSFQLPQNTGVSFTVSGYGPESDDVCTHFYLGEKFIVISNDTSPLNITMYYDWHTCR